MCGLLGSGGDVRLLFAWMTAKRCDGMAKVQHRPTSSYLYPKIIPADQAAFLVPLFLHQDIRVLVNAGTASNRMTHLKILALSSEKGDQPLNKQSTVNMSRFAAVRRQARHRVSETLNAPPPPAASAQSTICIHLMPICQPSACVARCRLEEIRSLPYCIYQFRSHLAYVYVSIYTVPFPVLLRLIYSLGGAGWKETP